ncbi:MAG: 30S ribosomal protein S5 [bacterium]|nr:30S ribosomal protein S5 [bacterium]
MENKRTFGRGGRQQEKSEFDQAILDLARVTRVTQGGKHMSFRTCVIVGDRKGRVGMGLEKGKDVQLGVEKAQRQAKKHLIKVPIVNDTIPHMVYCKFKAARVMIKPAPRGAGIIAGGPVRVILELAGIPNASSKILGKTKNKITLAKATFGALAKLMPVKPGMMDDRKKFRNDSRKPVVGKVVKVEKKEEIKVVVKPVAVKKAKAPAKKVVVKE